MAGEKTDYETNRQQLLASIPQPSAGPLIIIEVHRGANRKMYPLVLSPVVGKSNEVAAAMASIINAVLASVDHTSKNFHDAGLDEIGQNFTEAFMQGLDQPLGSIHGSSMIRKATDEEMRKDPSP